MSTSGTVERPVCRRSSESRAPPLFPRPQLERAARALVDLAFRVGVTLLGLAVFVSDDAARAEEQAVAIRQIAFGQVARQRVQDAGAGWRVVHPEVVTMEQVVRRDIVQAGDAFERRIARRSCRRARQLTEHAADDELDDQAANGAQKLRHRHRLAWVVGLLDDGMLAVSLERRASRGPHEVWAADASIPELAQALRDAARISSRTTLSQPGRAAGSRFRQTSQTEDAKRGRRERARSLSHLGLDRPAPVYGEASSNDCARPVSPMRLAACLRTRPPVARLGVQRSDTRCERPGHAISRTPVFDLADRRRAGSGRRSALRRRLHGSTLATAALRRPESTQAIGPEQRSTEPDVEEIHEIGVRNRVVVGWVCDDRVERSCLTVESQLLQITDWHRCEPAVGSEVLRRCYAQPIPCAPDSHRSRPDERIAFSEIPENRKRESRETCVRFSRLPLMPAAVQRLNESATRSTTRAR